jgi:hypothetical protein
MVWEYKIVFFLLEALPPQTVEEDEYEENLYDGADMLNEIGKEGWELVTFFTHRTSTNINKHHAVLKRPRAS